MIWLKIIGGFYLLSAIIFGVLVFGAPHAKEEDFEDEELWKNKK